MTDLKTYAVRAVYKTERVITVAVGDGLDPLDPDNWGEIEDEHEEDFYLADVISYEEVSE